jgi:hypothetical protein
LVFTEATRLPNTLVMVMSVASAPPAEVIRFVATRV